MPVKDKQIKKRRKPKTASLLINRMQRLQNGPKPKSFLLMYNKLKRKNAELKHNNKCLAKALTKEKQENQLLLEHNVSLLSQNHELQSTCTRQDVIIESTMKSASSSFTTLLKISENLTNTIAMCQDYFRSSRDFGCSSGRKESLKRMSTKSPAKGVVKPMVSGHTITKPTINLSRVNMTHIQNGNFNLTTIDESVRTSDVQPEDANPQRTLENTSISRQLNFETNRPRALPGRIPNESLRSDDEEEPNTSRREERHSRSESINGNEEPTYRRSTVNRISTRTSGKFERRESGRISDVLVRRASGPFVEKVSSPRVALNDVSKLMQNSQTVNLKKLFENSNSRIDEELDEANIESMNHDSPEPTALVKLVEKNGLPAHNADSSMEITECIKKPQIIVAKTEIESLKSKSDLQSQTQPRGLNPDPNVSSDCIDDPMEGPSWLLNEDYSTTNTNSNNITTEVNAIQKSPAKKKEKPSKAEENWLIPTDESSDEDFDLSYRPSSPIQKSPEKKCEEVTQNTTNFPIFVTRRRGCITNDFDTTNDFTLLNISRQRKNCSFHDLKIPKDLLQPMVPKPTLLEQPNEEEEEEEEVTTVISRITSKFKRPSFSSRPSHSESLYENNVFKLPEIDNQIEILEENNHEAEDDSRKGKQKRKRRLMNSKTADNEETDSSLNGKRSKKKSSLSKDKDPSSAKVVLQKLNPDVATSVYSDSSKPVRNRKFLKIESDSDSENSNAIAATKNKNHSKSKKSVRNSNEIKKNSKYVNLDSDSDFDINLENKNKSKHSSRKLSNKNADDSNSAQQKNMATCHRIQSSSDSEIGENRNIAEEETTRSRPRRKKAPQNFQEPSLMKKLRRDE